MRLKHGEQYVRCWLTDAAASSGCSAKRVNSLRIWKGLGEIRLGETEEFAILIHGYECEQRPIELAIDALEKLAGLEMADRFTATAGGLGHLIHRKALWMGFGLVTRCLG